MSEETKNNLKKMAEEAEMRIARSILRWKYRKEGKEAPMDDQLVKESRQVADRAHQVVVRRGKNVLDELKKVYKNKG